MSGRKGRDWEEDKFEELPFTATTDNQSKHPHRGVDNTASAVRTQAAEGTLQTKIDENSSTEDVYYVGKARPGLASSSAGWQIKRITITDTGSPSKLSVDVEFADGNPDFDNIYDNRESLSYS